MKSLLYTTTKIFIITFFLGAVFSNNVSGQSLQTTDLTFLQQLNVQELLIEKTAEETEELKQTITPQAKQQLAGKRDKAIYNIVPRIKPMMAAKGKNKVQEFIPQSETKLA